MIKTKLARYGLIQLIIALMSTVVGFILGLLLTSSIYWYIDRLYISRHGFTASGADSLSAIMFLAWLFSTCCIIVGLDYLVLVILRPILHCNIEYCNGRDYPEGFYILKRSDQPRELALSNLKTGGYIECIPDTYSVCVGFSYADVEMAICRMEDRLHSVYWEIPRVYIMPDGVTCLQRPKISLAAALKARGMLREDETAFFVYHVSYPDRKGQLAHTDRDGEIVVIDIDIDTENSADYNAPA